MHNIDIEQAKRANPQLDADELDKMLEDLRSMPGIAKQGYRLAPVGSDRVFTEKPWKIGRSVRSSSQARRC